MNAIYKIQNMKTGKIYIGESADVLKRFRKHIICLNNKKHNNYKLQSDFNLYNADSFNFYILYELPDDATKESRVAYEDYFIERYNSIEEGYNIQKTIDCNLYDMNREKALEIRKGLTDLVELNIYCCSAKDDIINTAKLNRAFKNTYDYSFYINTCKSTLTNCLAEIQNRGYTIYVSSNDLAKLFRESGFYEKVNNNYIIADKCKKSFYAEFDEQAGYSSVLLTEFGKEALFKLLTLIDALD